MQSDVPQSSNSEAGKGLPPVTPPTGKFMAQLFLVPFLIVVCVVAVFLGVTEMAHWLVGGPSNPERLLKNLDDSNPEVRWRAADDLAQVLLRDDTLASNPRFALELCERLQNAVQSTQQAERDLAERLRRNPAEDLKEERKELEAQQDFVQYLSASVGNLIIPAGAPLLNDMAIDSEDGDPERSAMRRRQAAWALANLGANLKRFDRLPAESQAAALAELEDEAERGSADRADWARTALTALEGRQSGSPQAIGVDTAMAVCAGSDDPFLREMAAFALTFWEGTPEENARMEQTLYQLSFDTGRGAEEDARAKALAIRYNATRALARRGSDRVRLPVLEEMLDEEAQREHFRVRLKDGRETTDEIMARTTVVSGLRAVAALHEQKPDLDLSTLYPAVDRLTQSSNEVVRIEAEKTRLTLGLAN